MKDSLEERPKFELVMLVRDNAGRATGQKKHYCSDNSQDIWSYYLRHSGKLEKEDRPQKSRKDISQRQKMRDNLHKDVQKLANLDQGWDGKLSPRINLVVINQAKDLISNIFDIISFKPKIIPTNTGGVQLDFVNKSGRELELRLEAGGKLKYLKWSGEENESDILLLQEIPKIRELVLWVSLNE